VIIGDPQEMRRKMVVNVDKETKRRERRTVVGVPVKKIVVDMRSGGGRSLWNGMREMDDDGGSEAWKKIRDVIGLTCLSLVCS
jgi:hypothetical protein